MEKNETSLAFELLQELRGAYKRIFIIAIIEFVIIVGMIIGFFVYESQFDYVTTTEQTQEAEADNDSEITQTIN